MSELPDVLTPFAWLLGSWEGEGVGGYPTIGSDFRFGQRVTFSYYGKPVIEYSSQSWAVDDGRPLARESGFWRPVSRTELEVVLVVASGLVEIFYGGLVTGPAGAHVEIQSDVVARTATAKEVVTDKRLYAVRGGQLMYAMEMAAAGQPLQPHLSAALSPA